MTHETHEPHDQNQLDCRACADLLVGYDEGVLDQADRTAVDKHLEQCGDCRAAVARVSALRARLENAGASFRAAAIADAVMAQIDQSRAVQSHDDHDHTAGPVEHGPAARSSAPPVPRRRTHMQRNLLRYAAALAACTAVVSTGWFVWPRLGASGAAFAGVISKTREAKSVRFRISQQIDGEMQGDRVLMLQDSRLRVETPDNHITIGDMNTGERILLYTNTRTCVVDAERDPPHDINPYKMFVELADNIAEDLGVSVYEARPVRVFRAPVPEIMKHHHHGGAMLMVWADLTTSLPVRIEVQQEAPGPDGKGEVKLVVDEMDFAPMDDSLFSLTPPAGYETVSGTVVPEVGGLAIQRTMRNMLMACQIYQQEHEAWPDKLTQLERYGITSQALRGPRRPDLEIGYLYLRPGPGTQPDDVVISEDISAWTGWAAVGFWDSHTEIITDREKYIQLIDRATRRSASGK